LPCGREEHAAVSEVAARRQVRSWWWPAAAAHRRLCRKGTLAPPALAPIPTLLPALASLGTCPPPQARSHPARRPPVSGPAPPCPGRTPHIAGATPGRRRTSAAGSHSLPTSPSTPCHLPTGSAAALSLCRRATPCVQCGPCGPPGGAAAPPWRPSPPAPTPWPRLAAAAMPVGAAPPPSWELAAQGQLAQLAR
jgi:hypothetical protein